MENREFCTGKWYPAFNKKKLTKITRWEKFRLFFKKKQYSWDEFGVTGFMYKTLKGKIFVLQNLTRPPQGYNCRHSFTPSSV